MAGLATLTSRNSSEIRHAVLSAVTEAGEADASLCYSVASLDGVPVATDAQVHGDERVAAAVQFMKEHPELRPAFSRESFLHPSSIATRSFLDLNAITGSKRQELVEETSYWESVYRSNGITDQSRLLVFHGRRMVCFIGALRQGGPHFGAAERRRLAPLVPVTISALVAADHLDNAGLCSERAFLTARSDGSIEYTSPAAQTWLSRGEFADVLASAVRAFDRSGEYEDHCMLRRADARLLRLDGQGSVRYLVCLTPAAPLLRLPATVLSPAQREVAELAAAGATVMEIARALGKSRDTVKSHLRSVYERLHVSNRIELVGALEPTE